ncbi:MAG: hypothetical protein Q9186_003242 [Xanthomendoza sp. 1 TL-2023]
MFPHLIPFLATTIIVFLTTLPLSTTLSLDHPTLPLLPPSFRDTSTPPYIPRTISTPDGPLSGLQSIKIPNFFISNVWNYGGRPPPWLRPVDTANTTLLLDLVIAAYATRPSDEMASYGTIGPESSPALRGMDTRVVVKQWMRSNGSLRLPAVPVRNKEIAYAAQM